MLIDMLPQEIFDRALVSEFGIELILDDHTAAKNVRRRFYNERDKLRSTGNYAYDGLSFIIRDRCDLWIVPRCKISAPSKIKLLDCRPLKQRELPRKI